MNMRLLGARNLKEIIPAMVDASSLHSHVVAVPGDRLYDSNCEYFAVCLWVLDTDGMQTRACSTLACGRSSRRFERDGMFRSL